MFALDCRRRRRIPERMHDLFPHENLIQLLQPFLVRGQAQFLFCLSAPLWNGGLIYLVHPLIREQVILVLGCDFDLGKLPQNLVLVPAELGQVRV